MADALARCDNTGWRKGRYVGDGEVGLNPVDTGRTVCGHRQRDDACKVPDGQHEFGEGNGFNPDGHAWCQCCKLPICDEPMFKDRNQAYEEDGQCLLCIMENEDLTIEEVAAICARDT